MEKDTGFELVAEALTTYKSALLLNYKKEVMERLQKIQPHDKYDSALLFQVMTEVENEFKLNPAVPQ